MNPPFLIGTSPFASIARRYFPRWSLRTEAYFFQYELHLLPPLLYGLRTSLMAETLARVRQHTGPRERDATGGLPQSQPAPQAVIEFAASKRDLLQGSLK
jgi:hypothetical protein